MPACWTSSGSVQIRTDSSFQLGKGQVTVFLHVNSISSFQSLFGCLSLILCCFIPQPAVLCRWFWEQSAFTSQQEEPRSCPPCDIKRMVIWEDGQHCSFQHSYRKSFSMYIFWGLLLTLIVVVFEWVQNQLEVLLFLPPEKLKGCQTLGGNVTLVAVRSQK